MMLKKIVILTISINILYSAAGQELRQLYYNPALPEATKAGSLQSGLKSSQAIMAVNTIEIDTEFFEDFSDYSQNQVFPKSNNWSDRYAFINSSFADSMISIGVATLDAFDENGLPYAAINIHPIPSDTLSSSVFDFVEPTDTSWYFSFFYQAGGKGDMPEKDDSLLLDFYYAGDQQWYKQMYLLGGEHQHSFRQMILAVPDSFIMDGFRFRFRNYTSIINPIIDKQSNADQWHIDYIQLKKGTDSLGMTKINDATIMAPLLPSLTKYSAVPYHHLSFAQSSIIRKTIPLHFRTIFPDEIENIKVSRTYISKDLITGLQIKKVGGSGGFENPELPVGTFYYQDYFTADYPYNAANEKGKLELTAFIEPGIDDQRKINDTVRRIDYFYDYYAYDDGTAEFGFGVSGENQDTIKIATRYRIYRPANNPDTLRAIYICFNKTMNNSTANIPFKICVWNNDNGKPGNEIYESSEFYLPDTTRGMNQFTRYELETPVKSPDTIYIGIKQPYAEFINIGYDINYNSLENLFVLTSLNGWYNPYSLDPGSVMMRPSFGDHEIPLPVKNKELLQSFSVFPVPARDVLYIRGPETLYTEPVHCKVFNIYGMLMMDTYPEKSQIDISSLDKGLYILTIRSAEGNSIESLKFIKE